MEAKPKRRIVTENGDTGEDLVLATLIGNGDDVGPLVRHAFEMGRPEPLVHQLKNVARKKEAEIEDLCKTHYEEFIVAVDELRGVLVDAEELKSDLATDNFRLQEVGSALLVKLEELLESYAVKKNVTEAIKMSKICVQALELCVKCNSYVSEGQFYHALKTMDLIERNYLKIIPLKVLKLAIERRIPVIKSHIEKKSVQPIYRMACSHQEFLKKYWTDSYWTHRLSSPEGRGNAGASEESRGAKHRWIGRIGVHIRC